MAAYCRVSSSSEDQLNSFAAQNIHYTQYITEHDDWRLVDIYADEGITGTSVEKRDDFKRMLADSGRGLIDRILVKSISRFARNTSECLEAIRQFRANGTTIFFEKENIDTARVSSELMTALHAAFAQAESESISGNIRWSYQKRIEREEFSAYSAPLGYDLVGGKLVINEKEANVVREIFDMYLNGMNSEEIAHKMNAQNTLSINWRRQRIEYILKNEKYKGDAILQKSYTTASFPRKRKNNHGERNAYYMEDSHAAIISDVDFETVQKIRAGHRRSTGITNTVLRGTLYCCCESPLRMRMSGQSVYWVCIRHSHNTSACPITQIPEAQVQQAFLRLYYNLKHQGSRILPDLITNLQSIRERKFLWSVDVIELNKQIAELTSQNQLLATLREGGCVDPDIFISKSNKLTEQLRAAKQAKSRILNQDGDDTIPCTQELTTILARGPEMLHDFDGELFGQLTDEISRAWSGMSTRQYKNLKGLKKENLRDNMTTLELVLNMLAEATTTEISKQKAPETFSENIDVARAGGKVAGDARKAIESQTGVPVITSKNAVQLNQVVTDLLEGAATSPEKQDKKR